MGNRADLTKELCGAQLQMAVSGLFDDLTKLQHMAMAFLMEGVSIPSDWNEKMCEEYDRLSRDMKTLFPAIDKKQEIDTKQNLLYLRYLGCLGLLGECSVEVEPETRGSIIVAMEDAAKHYPLRWRRVVNRIEIEPITEEEGER